MKESNFVEEQDESQSINNSKKKESNKGKTNLSSNQKDSKISLKKPTKTKAKIASEEVYGTENLWKILLRVTGPTVLMLLFVGMYNVTDALLASYLIPQNWGLSQGFAPEVSNPAIVAAGAYNSNIMYIVIAIITTINIGSEIKYAKLLSQGKHDEAKQLLNTTFSSTALITFIIFIIFLGVTPPIVEMLDNNSSTLAMDQATKYTQVELFWTFFYALSDMLIRILRVEGKAGWSSVLGSLCLPINLLFDWIFMWVVGTSLVGAGYASIIAEGITFFALLFFVLNLKRKNETNMFDKNSSYIPSRVILIASISIGSPVLFRSIIQTANSITITTFATRITVPDTVKADMISNGLDPNTFNSSSVAVYTELYALLFAVMTGVVQGSGSVIAFNYHQKKYDRVKLATLITLLYMFIWVLFIQVIFQTQISGFFALWSLPPNWPQEGQDFASILLMRSIFVGISYAIFGYYVSTNKLWESYLLLFMQSIIVFYIVVPVFWAVFKDSQNGYIWYSLSITISEIIVILLVIPAFIKEIFTLKKTPDGTDYPEYSISDLIPDKVRDFFIKQQKR